MAPLALLKDPADEPSLLPFSAGRTVELDPATQTLRLRNPEGMVELTVRVTAEGPVLSFEGARLELAHTGTVRLDVDKLEVHARQGVELETPGSVTQRIGGDHRLDCAGEARVEAGAATVLAHRGDLRLDSSEDVRIDGERVLVNC
jgi:hypothetical protein